MVQLGKYQLVAEIARGGMGIVYLAVAQGPARFSKLLVVKELKPELVDDPTFLEMFLEEARLAARLSHPNIVQTYEIGAEGKRHYIVMDYLEGVTLARVLRKKDERFTLNMQLRVICEALQGLQYAHSLTDFDGTPLGIVHRDATPQNVFITFDGTVKLVDFGIAKALDSTVETRTGVLKGKPAYMAPEQISGDVDPRADVFTVGVMIWEAAAGRRMWHKKGDVEVLTNIIKGQMPSLKEVAPNAPDALVRIVEKAVAKDKDIRYASAADLQADLEAYLVAEKAHITAREVGKLVAEMFAEERATTRSTIEAHLAQVKTGKTNDGKLPSLHPPAGDTGTPSGNRPSSLAGMTPTGGTPLSGATPSPAEVPNDARLEVEAQKFAAKRQKIITTGAIVAAIVVIGIIVGVTRKKEAPTAAITPPPDTAAAGGPTAKAPDQPPPPTTVIATATAHEINVKVIPSNATVTFDGKDMSNPARKTCQTGSRVLLRASANGYIPRERELRCEQDESLELVLQPMGLAAAPPPPPPRPATGAKTTPAQPPVAAADPPKPPPPAPPTRSPNEVNPNGGTRPNRPIDTSSPYGN